jgi:hypothetical protein
MDMTGNEVTHEKRCNILNYSNAMFKLFSKSSVSEIFLGPHVGESSGRDKKWSGRWGSKNTGSRLHA